MAKVYTLEDYAPFVGKRGTSHANLQPLPNPEPVDPLVFLNDLASLGHRMVPVWGYAKPPGYDRPGWTQFFLTQDANMSDALGGGGYAVTWGGSGAVVYRFRICKHEKEMGRGADERRGWSPGRCRLCGMDMTIDSGD